MVLTDRENASEIRKLLSGHFEIVEAENSDQALAKLRQGRFYMVISQGSEFLPIERAVVAEQAAVILETIGQGVAILALDGKTVWSNQKFNDLPADVRKKLSERCVELFRNHSDSVNKSSFPRRFTLQSEKDRYFEVTASPVVDCDDKIQNIAIAIWDATSTRQLQQKIDAIDKAGSELVRLETEVIEKLEIPQRLALLEDKIIRNTREILGYDNFCIRLLDEKTNRLELVLSSGLSERAKSIDISASSEGNGISGYVAATGRSYNCPDVQADHRYIDGIDNAASSLTVPLYLHDQVIGIFNIESEKPAAFSEDDRQFAEIFGRYVAIALHILDLMVVERHRATGKLADNVTTEISGPLNDILTEATAVMEEYIGQDDMRHRLQSICDNVARIRETIKHVGKLPSSLVDHKPSAPAVKDIVLSGKRVLIADDEPIILKTIVDILSKHGCYVDQAADGAKAIDLINEREKYDLILSDIKLPQQSGYQVFESAKAKEPEVPVVFMTGFGYDPNHSIIRANQEGLAGVLYKPFKVDELLTLLRDVVRESQKS